MQRDPRSGCPGRVSSATRPSGRLTAIVPSALASTTAVMPGPSLSCAPPGRPAASRASGPAARRSGCPARGDLGRTTVTLVGLVEGGGQQGPPGREPGPRQVGVAGLVAGGPARASASAGSAADAASVIRRWARRPIGSPPGGRRLARPPGDDRGVGQQQREQRRTRRGRRARRAGAGHGLAGAGVAEEPDLGVQPRLGAAGAADQRRGSGPGARAASPARRASAS